jgi:hypothetical protein
MGWFSRKGSVDETAGVKFGNVDLSGGEKKVEAE